MDPRTFLFQDDFIAKVSAMGGSEQYCGICGTSLESYGLDIGPDSGPNYESANRVRKALINEGLRKRAGQPEVDYDSDEYPEDEEGYYDAEKTYDPEIMAVRDVTLPNHDRFLGHVRLVMHDPKIKESSQYFISDEADPGVYGSAELSGHPERPNEHYSNIMYSAYGDHGNQMRAFPCHGLCLQLAAKVILGNPDSKLLDPETLYTVMRDDFHGGVNGNTDGLSLDHGDVEGAEQFWECIPGYEVSGTVLNYPICASIDMQAGVVLHHESAGVLSSTHGNDCPSHGRA